MNLEVVFTLLAEQDLNQIDDFIARESSSAARAFVVRVEQQRALLSRFPQSGRLRQELGPDVRTLVLPGRAVIAYKIEASRVSILRIFYGGQDIEAQLHRDLDVE